ncbi:hypothetical protein [Nonomuraea sp. NPDC049625]|uniref:hypothetical protein n=1 Tax=Nonomuraea sp. NPDC049625 TaxID=3155775 RepID=UPI0034412C4F
MASRITLAATILAALLTASPASAHVADGWHDEAGWGSVTISADRKHITVCDLSNDGRAVRVEYATSYLQKWAVIDRNGARWGCGTDSTFFSRITAFKLCEGRAFGTCRLPVWISRSSVR